MEPDARYYRRRATEELAAANRAVTQAARERRMHLANVFLERLRACETQTLRPESGPADVRELHACEVVSVFDWQETRAAQHAG